MRTKRGIKGEARRASPGRPAARRFGWANATFDLRDVFGSHKAPTLVCWIAAPRPSDALCWSMWLKKQSAPSNAPSAESRAKPAAHRRAVPRQGDLAGASVTFDLWDEFGDHKVPTLNV